MSFVSIKHSMPAGDLLSVLPGLKQVSEDTRRKWIIHQRVNLSYGSSAAYPGAIYSVRDENGTPVTMNDSVFYALRPLLLAQEYIEDFVVWDGGETTFDLDMLREQDSTMPYGSINRWLFYLWPDTATDLSKEWLRIPYHIDQRVVGKIIINRTERYNNMLISYQFLKKYGDNVVFVGLQKEYEVFCKQHKLDIPRLEVNDFLQIAIALYNCKLYIGSQSSIFQVAEGLKVPRILEVCQSIPNVIGSGPGFYDFLKQKNLEYYVEKLFNQ